MTETKTQLPEKLKQVLDKKAFAHSATLMEDGSPHVTPTWVETDGEQIVINSEQSRIKPRNLERDSRIALSVTDPDDPYTGFWIRGKVTEITEEGGAEGIDRLAQKYLDEEQYPWNKPGDVRVQIFIEAEKIGSQGG